MRALIAALALASLTACEKKQPQAAQAPAPQGGTPVVYTTFYPTEYFATRIGGEHAEVHCPVPADADAIFWKPSREAIAEYQQADLIIVNGAKFEKWVATASLPESRIVDTAAGFEDEWVTYESTTHSHGGGGEHSHEGIDGHTWVDPVNASDQAKAIRDALVKRAPAHKDAYRVAYVGLMEDLSDLGARFAGMDVSSAQLFASHPAYNYVAKRYDWDIRNFDLDPEYEIGAEALAEIQGAVEPDRLTIMLWEAEPIEAVAGSLEALGVVNVTFSPCELLDDEARASGDDYLTIMNANLDRLQAALGQASDAQEPDSDG